MLWRTVPAFRTGDFEPRLDTWLCFLMTGLEVQLGGRSIREATFVQRRLREDLPGGGESQREQV